MKSTSSPQARTPPRADKRRSTSPKRKSHKPSPSPPSVAPSSPDKQVPSKSHRTSGTASPASKKKTVVSGSHKGSGREPATPGAVSGSAQPHLNATSAVGLGAKAPGVPSPSSSSAVSPTLSGQKAPGTPSPSSSSAVSPTLSGQKAPGTPSPSSSSAVSPTLRGQKAPGTPSPSSSSVVSPTLSGQKAPGTPSPSSSSAVSPTLRGLKAPGTPSPTSSSAVSPSLSGQGSPSSATRTCGRKESTPSMASPPGEDSDATLPKGPVSSCLPTTSGINLDQAHPVQPPEPKPPCSTPAQRPPPVQEPNSSDDGAASKESVLRPLSKMLSRHITKDKTPMKTNQAPQKTSSRTAPTTVGTNYYTTLKDLLQVSHAALAAPLYYGSGEGVLRAATFGGFGSRFLAAVYNVINLSAFFLDKQNISQLSLKGIILFTEPSCGSRYEELLKRILGVATAWHLFKHAGSPVEDHDTSLITVDDRVFTADEIFFITYCRSLCEVNKRNRCSDVLRQVTAFADTFKCKEGTPMRSLDRCGVVKDFEAKLRTETVDTVF
ncbi:hypothetical protein V5799_000280 [Amblyomma americanum]|uniref:Uncharacterized protein n=1 Tax=Amblyomma americanum TaxID=6943 RepID=A0AAQ4D3H0_AMBAM